LSLETTDKEERMLVKVIDSVCGTGKTEWAIKYMNEKAGATKFLYVTPYLKEIERIKESVNFKMETPKEGSKSKDFEKLLISGKNVITTHSLFANSGEELAEVIEAHGYELILDEVLDVLSPVGLGQKDIEVLMNTGIIDVKTDGTVFLTDYGKEIRNCKFKYRKELDIISTGNVLLVNESMMVWEFPVSFAKSFSNVTILTYLFDNQTMHNYLKSFGTEFNYYYLENYELISGKCSYDGTKYKHLINVYEGHLNNVGSGEHSLSSTWYTKKDKYRSKKIISNNAYNYFRHIVDCKSGEAIWTCPKNEKDNTSVVVRDYITAFVPMTARATNLYADRHNCAYLVNRFENPVIHNYFTKHGLAVDNDMYALSELIQWLFRSAIRKGDAINLYIPSARMRRILYSWLNGEVYSTHSTFDNITSEDSNDED